MQMWKPSGTAGLLIVVCAAAGRAQGVDLQAASAQVVKADTDFANDFRQRLDDEAVR
jgi:hypothetical protein